jgi:uncharacterized OB-fold protein
MSTPYQERPITAPVPTPEIQPLFDAAARGELLIKHCTDCGEHHWYPRAICPQCFSERTEWVQASGRGTIYSYSIARRVLPTAYAIAYVTLEEGVRMMTNIVDCDLDAIRIGQAVEVIFKPTDGGPPVPMFRPVSAGSAAIST